MLAASVTLLFPMRDGCTIHRKSEDDMLVDRRHDHELLKTL